MITQQQINREIEELEEQIDKTAEHLRGIEDHHLYEHVLGTLIQNIVGKTIDPTKEGSKCFSSSAATVKQSITKMTVSLDNLETDNKSPEELEYIS